MRQCQGVVEFGSDVGGRVEELVPEIRQPTRLREKVIGGLATKVSKAVAPL